MNIKRRTFVQLCAAACTLLLPGIATAGTTPDGSSVITPEVGKRIEKSIKASFGGGFSVQTHRQSDGVTYANIEHFGNRYAVASADLLDWKVVKPI